MTIFPKGYEEIIKEEKKAKLQVRKTYKESKKFQGSFGPNKIRIRLSIALLNDLIGISRRFHRMGYKEVALSDLIHDALVAHLEALQDNDLEYPQEEENLKPRNIVNQFFEHVRKKEVNLENFTKKEIIQFLKKEHPNELKLVSDKTLENYISAESYRLKKKRGRPLNNPFLILFLFSFLYF